MSAPTPGPWETSVNDEGQWDVCAEGGGDMVADLADCPESAEANARLIAAAPDLLAALRLTISALSLSTTHIPADRELVRQALRNAFSTIAKAEGKP